MARDDFSKADVDRLAKRAGMKCSYPDCRLPTSGPDAGNGTTNVGVAAHISAASPGGPRYDETLSAEQRRSITNAIWLCQNHAHLVDVDELRYPTSLLLEWKDTAEKMAALEARGFVVRKAVPFTNLEKKCPKLISEMREDLTKQPLVREFILLSSAYLYTGGENPSFIYYDEDHEYLRSMMTIMQHVGAIYNISFNDVPRYNFTEEFVAYLLDEAL